ncbi:hypothetical protein GCM10010304_63550 [Streptomyces roseoviolaceus]
MRARAVQIGERLRHAPLDDLQLTCGAGAFGGRRGTAHIHRRLDTEGFEGERRLQSGHSVEQPVVEAGLVPGLAVRAEEPPQCLDRAGQSPQPVHLLGVGDDVPRGLHGEDVTPDQRLGRVMGEPL